MVNNFIQLEKRDGEGETEFLLRVGSAKESGLIDATWEQIANFINTEFRTQATGFNTESTYRKKYNKLKLADLNIGFNSGQQEATKVTGNSQNKLEAKTESLLRKLECQKIQYRDERRAWQQQNYLTARVEHKLDVLEEKLLEQGRIHFSEHKTVDVSSDNDVLIILSDLHIGQTFNSPWGEYNTEVAKRRLELLLHNVVKIQSLHKSENCFVSLQGDLLNGNIRKTIQVSNRENVIEQIKIASEYIASFCYELTKYFGNVYLSNVSGNHSRIDKKEDAIHDERLDDIISWGVELTLKHIKNFHVLHTNIDSGIVVLDIRGKSYVAVHGDMDKFTESGVSKLCLHLGHIPYAITFGHLHTCAFDEANGVKMIRSGSLAGSGDSYTIEKRLSGQPSQMVCVCDTNGVRCCYPIILL